MHLMKSLILAVVAGLLGAAAWAGIGYFANLEVGFVAWGIGALVGAGAGFGAGVRAGPSSGVLAVIVAAVAIVAGKGAVIGVLIAEAIEQSRSFEVTDDMMIALDAERIMDTMEVEAEAPMSSGGVLGAEQGEGSWWEEDAYPPEVWAQAEAGWAELTPDEQAAQRESLESAFVYSPEDVTGMFFNELRASFSLFDVLWFALAMFSAYKLGASSMGIDPTLGGAV